MLTQNPFYVAMLFNWVIIPDRKKKITQYLSSSDLQRNYQLDMVTFFLHDYEKFEKSL